MMTFSKLKFLQNCIRTGQNCQIRWRSQRRPDWFQFRRPTEPHELAKEFFDGLYSKRFGKDWPSIRCALLSRKKYAAIVNNFGKSERTEQMFIADGAVDIVHALRSNAKEMCRAIASDITTVQEELRSRKSEEHNGSEKTCEVLSKENPIDSFERWEPKDDAIVSESTDAVLYERLEWLSDRYNLYEKLTKACYDLQVYGYPKKNLSEFDDPLKTTSSTLDYFLLDGSSILPVLALDPQPDEHIFDTCAAPGGKLMCILQLCKDGTGTVVANDISGPRTSRIRKVINEYIPGGSSMHDRLKVIKMDMTDWDFMETSVYDKVLVDVPCTTDRHSVFPTLEQRDNIFSQLRKRERANLPQLQSDILTKAMLSCRPGGSVVYSTCTASLQQNEYVVQMTIQQLLQKHGVTCEIKDLTPLTHLLKDHFHFFKETELGVLVLPFLDANYGPTYVCKILRVR